MKATKVKATELAYAHAGREVLVRSKLGTLFAGLLVEPDSETRKELALFTDPLYSVVLAIPGNWIPVFSGDTVYLLDFTDETDN